VWESGEEDAGVTTKPIDITSIVLATIADTMERWGK
jgi:hypothetical protein